MNPVDFIPPHYKALAIGITLIAIVAASFSAGCQVTLWRKNAEIAAIKKERSDDRAAQSVAALDDITKATKTINDAAIQYAGTETALGVKIDAIRRDLKNVQAKAPLPIGCRPDAGRLRNLKNAVDAANASTAR